MQTEAYAWALEGRGIGTVFGCFAKLVTSIGGILWRSSKVSIAWTHACTAFSVSLVEYLNGRILLPNTGCTPLPQLIIRALLFLFLDLHLMTASLAIKCGQFKVIKSMSASLSRWCNINIKCSKTKVTVHKTVRYKLDETAETRVISKNQ